MEWLKRRLRGTFVHRLARRGSPPAGSGLAASNTAYDRQTVEVMRRVLRPDSTCVDVGAHVGDILRHMIAVAPDGAHHAFEALPHLAAGLRERFPGVRVHGAAVADRGGEAEFQYVENAPAYSGLRRRVYDRPDPRITTIRVAVVTLDEAVPPDPPVAFLKLDIEGGEYHALRGAVETVRRGRPVIVFEAGRKSTGQYGVTPDDLYGFVTRGLGYDLSTMARWLGRAAAYTADEFRHNWEHGPDYYFIATPAGATG
ncbi:MAG: FkbM family methyltransferase [Gemmataceae bacterium]|nr:FkbM family methyltransferase [Gemmataceae bacterium]